MRDTPCAGPVDDPLQGLLPLSEDVQSQGLLPAGTNVCTLGSYSSRCVIVGTVAYFTEKYTDYFTDMFQCTPGTCIACQPCSHACFTKSLEIISTSGFPTLLKMSSYCSTVPIAYWPNQ